jgi:hypothetical protein
MPSIGGVESNGLIHDMEHPELNAECLKEFQEIPRAMPCLADGRARHAVG